MAASDSNRIATQTTVLRIPKSARSGLSPRLDQLPLDLTRPEAGAAEKEPRLYREFVEGIYDAVLIASETGWIIDANSRATEFLGFSAQQFKGLRITDILWGANDELFHRLVAELMDGTRLILEADCIRRDRSTFPSEITVSLIHVTEHHSICFMIRNITRRVEAEEAQQESERRFRDISESMSDWIWEIDLRGHYTFCSERVCPVLGYPVADLMGRSIFHHTTLEHRALGQKRFNELVGHDRSFRNLEVWLRTHDNQWRCISFSGCPTRDPDGRLIGFRGIASDITETKTKDAELERHRNHLEELVQQRTEELVVTNRLLTKEIGERRRAEDEIRTAAAELKRSNDELQQFCYVVSHDLKEPLRMIAGYCQLLERRYKEALDDDARDFIQYAVDGAEKMQRMIDDLLAYSRLNTRERHNDDCDLGVVVGHAIRNLRFAIEESHAEVIVGELPIIKGDRTQLLLLFQNLIGNALKFRQPDTHPHIVVDCEAETVEDDTGSLCRFWQVTVADNGIGIPPESQEDVFLIFHRLHDRHAYEGTGMGLALCRKIVENHGGIIGVTSAPGEGTTFIVTLPMTPES